MSYTRLWLCNISVSGSGPVECGWRSVKWWISSGFDWSVATWSIVLYWQKMLKGFSWLVFPGFPLVTYRICCHLVITRYTLEKKVPKVYQWTCCAMENSMVLHILYFNLYFKRFRSQEGIQLHLITSRCSKLASNSYCGLYYLKKVSYLMDDQLMIIVSQDLFSRPVVVYYGFDALQSSASLLAVIKAMCSSNLSLEDLSAAEFSSSPDQTHLPVIV